VRSINWISKNKESILEKTYQKIFFWKNKKRIWKRNGRAIFSCIICQCETKTVQAISWKPFIYNIKQCLNLESYDLKLTVIKCKKNLEPITPPSIASELLETTL